MPSALPDWWGDLLASLWETRGLTAYTLTTQTEPRFRGGVLTLVFPAWVDAAGWWLRQHDRTMGEVIRERDLPVRSVGYAWRSTQVPADWPREPTALLDALAIRHASACWRHGSHSPQAQEARERYADAACRERERIRRHAHPSAPGRD